MLCERRKKVEKAGEGLRLLYPQSSRLRWVMKLHPCSVTSIEVGKRSSYIHFLGFAVSATVPEQHNQATMLTLTSKQALNVLVTPQEQSG